ncbi:hypothetical protein HGRIS_011129 [Hohenbuehelia grisea]|uniref:Uncharacterized protein n=1 Tax=Hohenbuehelia grisea TaxID=104357 RepID=A0ABR3IZE1_9AGAR
MPQSNWRDRLVRDLDLRRNGAGDGAMNDVHDNPVYGEPTIIHSWRPYNIISLRLRESPENPLLARPRHPMVKKDGSEDQLNDAKVLCCNPGLSLFPEFPVFPLSFLFHES